MNAKDFLQRFERFRYKHGMSEVLSDCFKLYAIEISNKFDYTYFEDRQTIKQEIIKKYSKEEVGEFYTSFSMLVQEYKKMIDEKTFHDLLGEIYMLSETSSKTAGQFFTPFTISRLMAELNVSGINLSKEIISLNDCACGSSGMIIATVENMYQKGINYADRILAVVQDIDARCVAMSYVQLSLLGIPAVVLKGDTLSYQFTEEWRTPAFMLQFNKFSKALKELSTS